MRQVDPRSVTVDRRQVMAGGAALVAALGLPSAPVKAQPRRGGTLRIGLGHGSTTDTLDPATTNNFFMQVFNAARQNRLTETRPDGSLVGELAESWEASPDAVTWTFKLRRGVEFHNGKTLDGADVIASLSHHAGEASKSGVKAIVSQIDGMKVDGDHVVITLKSGNADFPVLVSDPRLPILPARDGAADWASGVGTGGYVIGRFEPGVRGDLTRNPNYWKPNAAFFDAATVLAIGDVAARTNALVTGEIDVMDKVDLKTVGLLEQRSDVRILQLDGTQHYTFAMSCKQDPFTDGNVRLALKHAIDREALLKTILHGYGRVGNDHPIAPSNYYFDRELAQRSYDPDRAKYHLKQAGLTGLTVSLSAADAAFAGAVDAAILFQQHAQAAGITVDVVREPNDGYWESVWLKKPFAASFWAGRPSENWMFSTVYGEGATWNETYWSNERFNALLVASRTELDEARRREMYSEMQRLVRDDGGAIIPLFASYVDALSSKLRHPEQVAANWDLDGFLLTERWWFE